jgi:uncharacterized protein YbjT (DUF2867 family)
MKIAVTTPTGHVGSAVTDFLLEFGGDITVKLLGRRPDKLQEYVDRGAEIAIGAQDDSDYLVSATRGVDALFWATPPGYGSDDLRAFQNRLGNAAATAIRTNKIPRVVNLSSVGANLSSGVGPINGLHDVEVLLDNVATNITHLRPGFFFENLLWQLESIRKWGRISLPISGTKSYPMIATRDIGRVAATRLASSDWTGHFVQELHGPADLTFKEVAQIVGEVLGRKIVYIKCDPQEMRDNILSAGMTEKAADLMLEMYDAFENGRLRTTQTRSNVTATSTTLNEFVREVVLPMIAHPVIPMQEI